VEFRILGPLEVWVDEKRVSVYGPRQQKVLAALLLNANRVAMVNHLIDVVWEEDPPDTAVKQVRNMVSNLRRQLAGTSAVIEPATNGYVISIAEMALDSHVFSSSTERARGHAVKGQTAEARNKYSAALATWRGSALAGLASPALDPEISRLNEQRLFTLEEANELELQCGRHHELVSNLAASVAEHPLRERLVSQLMLALYRSGRQAEALTYYDRTRRKLSEDLGIEPGPELKRIHHGIVTNDQAVAAPIKLADVVVPVRSNLPGDTTHFTGREIELHRLLSLAVQGQGGLHGNAVAISAIDGMAGIGKTTLAIHAVHRLKDRYPDAQLFLDLHAHTPGQSPLTPAIALEKLLRALGLPPEQIPHDLDDRASLWRGQLANRQALIVLDNAVDAAQVRPLLPGAEGCLVMVTSRNRLLDLDTASLLSLDVLPLEDARRLFVRIVGDDRPSYEPTAVDEVLELCGYLPLAVRLAATRMRHRPAWTIAHLVDRLRDQQQRLYELSSNDRGVATAFSLSYNHVEEDGQRLFRFLGLAPGTDTDVHATAALCATTRGNAEDLLEGLVDVHMVQQPEPGRYRLHDLLRTFAENLGVATGDEKERQQALTRLFDYYLTATATAMNTVAPGDKRLPIPSVSTTPSSIPDVSRYDRALQWLETELPNLLAATQCAASGGWPRHACYISTTLWRYFHIRGHHDDAVVLHSYALSSARSTGDQLLEANTLAHLGDIYWWTGSYTQAKFCQEQALTIARDIGDVEVLIRSMYGLGLTSWWTACYNDALNHFQAVLGMVRNVGNRVHEGYALHGLGGVYFRLGCYERARGFHERTLTIAMDAADHLLEAYANNGLGVVANRMGEHANAISYHVRTLDIARTTTSRALECRALLGLADTHRLQDRAARALALHQEALEVARNAANRAIEGRALHGLGEDHHVLGHHLQASTHYQLALKIARTIEDRALEAEVLNSLGILLRAADHHKAGHASHAAALAIAEDIGDPHERGRAKDGLAHKPA
jgi:DNA-binding SARP family transcriptional activator